MSSYADAQRLIAAAVEAENKQKWDLASAELYQAIEILQYIRNELVKHSREVPAVERMIYAHFPPFDGEES